jgi:hypothetical protein
MGPYNEVAKIGACPQYTLQYILYYLISKFVYTSLFLSLFKTIFRETTFEGNDAFKKEPGPNTFK